MVSMSMIFQCALIRLLYEGAVNFTPTNRFLELVMKCLWKVVRLFPEWEAEIDSDMVLYDIQLFLRVSTVSHKKILWL
jgi:cytoskeleton-associated protein 5